MGDCRRARPSHTVGSVTVARRHAWPAAALLALALLAGLLAPRAGAAPGGDATPTYKRLAAEPGVPAEVSAMCPAGRRATGGGFSIIDDLLLPGDGVVFGGVSASIDVQASGPVDETGQPENTLPGDVARGWYVRLAGAPSGFTDYLVTVLCSASSDAVVRDAPLAVPAGGTGTASVACSPGRATGGGVLPVGSSAGAVVRTTQPLDAGGVPASTAAGAASRGWFASVGSPGAGTLAYRVVALCSAASDVTITTAVLPGIAGENSRTGRACDDDSRTTGGGLGAASPASVTLRYAGPAGIDAPDPFSDFWEVEITSATDQVLTDYVVCARFDPTPPPAPGPAPPTPAAPGGGGTPGAGAPPVTTSGGTVARCAGVTATLVGTAAADTIRGTAGRDVIAALGGDDVVKGLGGNDLVCLGAGDDRADGGAGADRILGEAGADRIAGGPGADQLAGGVGRDVLTGGLGADRLAGGGGVDVLRGGAGRNALTQ